MKKIATLLAGIIPIAGAFNNSSLPELFTLPEVNSAPCTSGSCFTIETQRSDQASNPWCVDAYSCNGDAYCIGNTIGLRLCDPDTYPTQLFEHGSNGWIYLAFYFGLCFQVNLNDQLVVSYCGGRRQLQNGPANTKEFAFANDQFLALKDNKRYPAAIKPNSDTAELIFVQEGNPVALEAKQVFYTPPPQCYDSDAFMVWKGRRKRCSWVSENLCKRWKEIRLACPEQCASCNNLACKDSTLPFYKSKKSKDEWTCEMLSKLKPRQRRKKCKNRKFYTTCRKTCAEESNVGCL
mmetsp:Transcript_9692/g.11217  ORF Transcript_9692/g.11217 Transcript_9692/m.11217 type:complete len:293 (-) Transcript_9692:1451-2329(-)